MPALARKITWSMVGRAFTLSALVQVPFLFLMLLGPHSLAGAVGTAFYTPLLLVAFRLPPSLAYGGIFWIAFCFTFQLVLVGSIIFAILVLKARMTQK